jgi:hypothetical protein
VAVVAANFELPVLPPLMAAELLIKKLQPEISFERLQFPEYF